VKLPMDLPLFTGNHADLLIITLHKVAVSRLYSVDMRTQAVPATPYWSSSVGWHPRALTTIHTHTDYHCRRWW
jgi:hypothetical protein